MTYELYWGDLHSHCSVSYGSGTVEQALARARGQLDFCSITGHAFWPDMPSDRQRYGRIIDYHREGFARLARNWDRLLTLEDTATRPGEFVVLPSYEWHSLRFGDHNVYGRGPQLPLRDAPDLPSLREATGEALLIPHHIGYAVGHRGIDWRHFCPQRSPVVEIYSLHGCSESEQAPCPMLHDMGPRDAGSTAAAGWALGHRFGVIASSDHHGGYPGSHGDGRVAVLATELSRDALFDALRARRTYAATGDKIDARFFVDDAWMGSQIRAPGRRRIRLRVVGSDALDRVEVLKNENVLRRFHPDRRPVDEQATSTFRLRITWGWGRRDEPVRWAAKLTLSEGAIRSSEPCFCGQPVVAPQGIAGHDERPDDEDLPHEIIEQSAKGLAWRSITTGNRSTRHATTQGLSLLIEAAPRAHVTLEVNRNRLTHRLADLLRLGRAHYMRGVLSEAVRIGPLVPLTDCTVEAEFDDDADGSDMYRLRAAQTNGQWVWLSPVWVDA